MEIEKNVLITSVLLQKLIWKNDIWAWRMCDQIHFRSLSFQLTNMMKSFAIFRFLFFWIKNQKFHIHLLHRGNHGREKMFFFSSLWVALVLTKSLKLNLKIHTFALQIFFFFRWHTLTHTDFLSVALFCFIFFFFGKEKKSLFFLFCLVFGSHHWINK